MTIGTDETLYAWTACGGYEHYPPYLNVSRRGGKIVVTVRGSEYLPEPTPENIDDRWLRPGVLAVMTLPDDEAEYLAAALARARTASSTREGL